jgi:hypothetical protein
LLHFATSNTQYEVANATSLGKAAALDPHRDMAFPVPMHKGLAALCTPARYTASHCQLPTFAIHRFFETLHRRLSQKKWRSPISSNRISPLFGYAVSDTSSLQMSKAKATNFLRLVAFGLVIILLLLLLSLALKVANFLSC